MATKEQLLIRAARLRAVRFYLNDPLGLPILDAVIAALEEAAEEKDRFYLEKTSREDFPFNATRNYSADDNR